jgi:hypothetical protein
MKYLTHIINVFRSSPPSTYHWWPQLASDSAMAQPCKEAMAARLGLGHLLNDFEDSRRPSSLSPRFRRVPVDGWIWRPAEAETIYRQAPRAKRGANRAQSGLGWSAHAGRPRPTSARFCPGLLPGFFSRDPLFVCTCMWAFDVVSFKV